MLAPGFLPNSPLGDALVILGAAGIVIPVFARFRITPVIGFILVGLLVGPYGLGREIGRAPWLMFVTISDPAGLAPFANFGIVLLLFSLGLELSFGRLWRMRRQVFGVGALELVGAAVLIGSAVYMLGQPPGGALGLGLALAMSSTALALPIVGTQTAVGKAALAMLLFEDLALVPIIFLLGAMAPGAEQGIGGITRVAALGGLVVLGLLVFGRLLLPRLFAQAARTKSPELFLSASLLVVILASLATAGVGLSPIVGALIAGILISETDYHTQVEIMTAPFKGLALGVFLITVGMGIDLREVWQQLGPIALATAAVLLIKSAVTSAILWLMGARKGTAAEAGILLASPSETTLIVLSAATTARLIAPDVAHFWQIVTAIGLILTPLLAMLGRRTARRVDRAATLPVADSDGPRSIIVGFGRVGQLVADMLTQHGKRFVSVDSDADLIAQARRQGYPAVYGNADGEALNRLGVATASAVILTMDEPVTAQRLVRKLRGLYPELPIIARARDPHHAAMLYRAGATHAVPETLESSLQLSEAVLVDLGVAMGPVIASIHEKRDFYRVQIMEEGELEAKPKLRTGLRQRPPD